MFARTRKSGFTLVEILIVVIILGILAAIVIPQFTNASQDAPMTTKTDINGAASVNPNDFGPYMQSAPTNPINTLSTVTNGDTALAAAAADCGFIYDYNAGAGTGRIWGTGTDKRTKFPE